MRRFSSTADTDTCWSTRVSVSTETRRSWRSTRGPGRSRKTPSPAQCWESSRAYSFLVDSRKKIKRKSFQKKRGCLMTLTYNQKIMDEIRGEHKKSQKKLDEIFHAAPERLERFSTVSDKEIKNLYTPEDVAGEGFSGGPG